MNKMMSYAAGLALLAATGGVCAAPIVGGILFGEDSTWTPATFPTNTGNTLTATGFNAFTGKVLAAVGDLSAETGTVSFSAFTWSPSSLPVLPLWETTSWKFDLTSVVVTVQNATQIGLTGTGIFHDKYGGKSDAFGKWNITADKYTMIVGFDSISETPAPATLALLGFGLIAVGFASRSRAKRADAAAC
ncbi:MAG: PEP-CTERM sorting domain-containing protein [Gammaproteobacteria bacterium]|nr:PEP-CTERM sorting domain-containing protein [Gammaproteobacteria bacterium]